MARIRSLHRVSQADTAATTATDCSDPTPDVMMTTHVGVYDQENDVNTMAHEPVRNDVTWTQQRPSILNSKTLTADFNQSAIPAPANHQQYNTDNVLSETNDHDDDDVYRGKALQHNDNKEKQKEEEDDFDDDIYRRIIGSLPDSHNLVGEQAGGATEERGMVNQSPVIGPEENGYDEVDAGVLQGGNVAPPTTDINNSNARNLQRESSAIVHKVLVKSLDDFNKIGYSADHADLASVSDTQELTQRDITAVGPAAAQASPPPWLAPLHDVPVADAEVVHESHDVTAVAAAAAGSSQLPHDVTAVGAATARESVAKVRAPSLSSQESLPHRVSAGEMTSSSSSLDDFFASSVGRFY